MERKRYIYEGRVMGQRPKWGGWGGLITVKIWRMVDDAEPTPAVRELTFSGDDPIVIDWPEAKKFDPVWASSLTLRVVSETDRQFLDLYTVKAGSVGVEVWVKPYEEDTLVWCGTLDPEQYEEPYESNYGYDVDLVFSDFGILDRVKYDLHGRQSLWSIIYRCLVVAKLNDHEANGWGLTTEINGRRGTAMLQNVYISSANFYDEEGEPMTYREVLEGVLQPLAGCITQRIWSGILIFDMNSRADQEPQEIVWTGDSSTLGIDSIYSVIRVKFSPYGDSKLFSPDTPDDEVLKGVQGRQYNLSGESEIAGFICRFGADPTFTDYDPHGHDLFSSESEFSNFSGHGVALLYCNNHVLSSDTSPRLLKGFQPIQLAKHDVDKDVDKAMKDFSPTVTALSFDTTAVAAATRGNKEMLRLQLTVMASCKYNPVENRENIDINWNREQQKWLKYTGWAYIPCNITCKDSNGEVWHFENNWGTDTYYKVAICYSLRKWQFGKWVKGSGKLGDLMLEFYDTENLGKSPFESWTTNRQMTIPTVMSIPEILRKIPDGEYIPLPPFATNSIHVDIGRGFLLFRDNGALTTGKVSTNNLRWVLYKDPKLEVVKGNGNYKEADSEDIEYSGQLNTDAADELSLDTICGTCTEGVLPTARGVFTNSEGLPIGEATRAGHTEKLENLLIGTIYSQYAEPKIKLQGEFNPYWADMLAMADPNFTGKKFLCVAKSFNVFKWLCEGTYVEISPEDYTEIKEAD